MEIKIEDIQSNFPTFTTLKSGSYKTIPIPSIQQQSSTNDLYQLIGDCKTRGGNWTNALKGRYKNLEYIVNPTSGQTTFHQQPAKSPLQHQYACKANQTGVGKKKYIAVHH